MKGVENWWWFQPRTKQPYILAKRRGPVAKNTNRDIAKVKQTFRDQGGTSDDVSRNQKRGKNCNIYFFSRALLGLHNMAHQKYRKHFFSADGYLITP